MSATHDSDPAADSNGRDEPAPRPHRSGGVSDWMKALRDVAPYLDLGWRLAGAAAFPPLIGYAVDAWMGTLPWGVLIGAGLGLASAAVQLRRLQNEFGR